MGEWGGSRLFIWLQGICKITIDYGPSLAPEPGHFYIHDLTPDGFRIEALEVFKRCVQGGRRSGGFMADGMYKFTLDLLEWGNHGGS